MGEKYSEKDDEKNMRMYDDSNSRGNAGNCDRYKGTYL